MQELYHRIEQLRFAEDPIDKLITIRDEMIQKEKDQIIRAFASGEYVPSDYIDGRHPIKQPSENYYDQRYSYNV